MIDRKILVISALPFRIRGNQSLFRFISMLLEHGCDVFFFQGGKDECGEHDFKHANLKKNSIITIRDFLHGVITRILSTFTKQKVSVEPVRNKFLDINSEDDLPPFGRHTPLTMVNKWLYFIFNYLDNVIAFFYLVLFKLNSIWQADLIVGYECNYAFCARWLSLLFRKPLVTKYQGVTLHATKRNLRLAKLYYPLNYFGIVKSDLCIMVDDGTDGAFYAKARGCGSIHFAAHGVKEDDYRRNSDELNDLRSRYPGKLILANVASGSSWKRVDRLVRALSKLPSDVRRRVVVFSTYYGPDRLALEEFVCLSDVRDCFEFVDDYDQVACNRMIRTSDYLEICNDLSNQGNPVL